MAISDRKMVTGKKYKRSIILILLAIALCLVLIRVYGCGTKRVKRKHADKVSKVYEQVARRIDFKFRGHTTLSKKEVERDLDELEWILENRYSYLKLRGVDYKNALDSIRSSVGDKTGRGTLALQLMKLIALFGDGHSAVSEPGIDRMFPGFLPFLIEESNNRLVAFKADRSAFLSEEHPYIARIDGKEITVWLDTASKITAKGSKQYIRFQNIRNLRYIQYLRRELGLDESDEVEVELESMDKSSTVKMSVKIASEKLRYGSWPKTQSRILEENIGYLRIPLWMSNEREFLDELIKYMNDFRATDGLIIDIRGIGGGSRAPLRVLLPFFMADDDIPKVVNIASYRLGHRNDILDARWLYTESWDGWSSDEIKAIKEAAEKFKPQWVLPDKQFSDWHYFVIGPSRDNGTYYYKKPVIILMGTANYSASDIFLGAFKGHNNVTLMGTPSGGGSGRYQKYRLKNSLIGIRLSSMASFLPDGKLYDGNGIEPDVYIEPIPTDFIGKTDSVLQAAIQRIKNEVKKWRK